LLLSIPAATWAGPPGPLTNGPAVVTRVRPHDSRSIMLLSEGLQRSETLRRLVDRLNQHDVIVYIVSHPTLKRELAGSCSWMGATASARYVRVSISTDRSTTAAIAVLGHELQHAVEIAMAPSIVDAASFEAFYRQHGVSSGAHRSGWDTEAAREMGEEVRKELSATRSARVTDSLQRF